MEHLYEIAAKYRAALDGVVIDPVTGEVAGLDELNAVEGELNEKVEGIANYIKELTAMSAAMRQEEKNLAERRKAIENRVSKLQEYIAYQMSAVGKTKVETATAAVTLRKSKSVDIPDEAAFVQWAEMSGLDSLISQKTTANKTEIKKAIEAGMDIVGANIVEKTSISIK